MYAVLERDHGLTLLHVLDKCQSADLHPNLDKCQINKQYVKFYGTKVDAIRIYRMPLFILVIRMSRNHFNSEALLHHLALKR